MRKHSLKHISKLREVFLKHKEVVSKVEKTSGNYDSQGKLIREEIPTLTTNYCEIGIYKGTIYLVFIIFSKTYSKSLFDSVKKLPNIQIYGFKNFKATLYPRRNFNYVDFEKQIKKDKYLQFQFNYSAKSTSTQKLYKKYINLKNWFDKSQAKVVDQINYRFQQ